VINVDKVFTTYIMNLPKEMSNVECYHKPKLCFRKMLRVAMIVLVIVFFV